uniref:Reverse transcriptase domain-containing protein n=1 Tax=Tanacetum cinerariifolium TaxID=118510 RepID=A0A699HSD2_TANCI|nr:hypothetical protein [Tanacetum cinerariifolium]
MCTRNSFFPDNSSVTIPRRRNKRRTPNVVEPELYTIIEVAKMTDNQTMEELLQAPTEGYGEAIVIPEINADHFEIKKKLLQLVQANPYHGFERETPHTHINNFKRITSTLKFKDVPNDVIKLMMFPYSLEGNARVWMNTTCLENASKSVDRIDKLADQISTLVDTFAKKVVTPATVKEVEEYCVTCGGAHAYYNCPNTDRNQPSVCVATGTYNQIAPQNHTSNYMASPGFAPGPSIPTNPSPKKVVEWETEETTDKEQTNFQGTMLLKKLLEKLGDPGKFLIPSDRSITHPKGVAEDVFVKVEKFHFLIDFVVVDFEVDPRVPLILGRSFLRTSRALIDVYGEEIALRVNDETITFNLKQTTEEYAHEILGFSNNSAGGNPTLTFEPILSDSSPSLTPFEGSDFILEEIEVYLKDESISPEIDHANCDSEGDICLIEKLLNDDPFQLPLIDFKQ